MKAKDLWWVRFSLSIFWQWNGLQINGLNWVKISTDSKKYQLTVKISTGDIFFSFFCQFLTVKSGLPQVLYCSFSWRWICGKLSRSWTMRKTKLKNDDPIAFCICWYIDLFIAFYIFLLRSTDASVRDWFQ